MKYKAFHRLTYGLYIVASEYEGQKSGYIANTAFQVTSEPSQIAISCHKENRSCSIIRKSRMFSLSVLKKELDTSIIGEFGFMSGDEFDKFSNVKYQVMSTGVPVVTESSVAWFECKVVKEADVGSHILFISEVVNAGILSDEEPLTYQYYREKYKMLAPKNAPTYIDEKKLRDEQEKEQLPEEVPEKKEKETSPGREYTCTICGFTYNPEEGDPTAGIPPGTPFEELPEEYKCPVCNAGKDYFN